jgi:hypothetical protein
MKGPLAKVGIPDRVPPERNIARSWGARVRHRRKGQRHRHARSATLRSVQLGTPWPKDKLVLELAMLDAPTTANRSALAHPMARQQRTHCKALTDFW